MIEKLKKRLDRIENKLFNISVDTVRTKETSNFYWSRTQSKIKKLYDEARIIFALYSNEVLPKSFDESMRLQIRRIKNLKFKTPSISYYKLKNTNNSNQSKQAIVQDSISNFSIGLDSGYKKLTRLLRATQQLNISENQLDKSAIEGYQTNKSLYGVKKKLVNDLSKDALDKKFITVIDKNGKPINYQIKTYAEMVARTKIIQSQADAVIQTALSIDSDLVQMSSHNTNCPICAPIEGKIYSISGKDPDFPALDFTVPLHPNCEHSFTVIFKDVLEERGIQKYIDFAQGKTDEHPTLTKYKPISKRDIGNFGS